MSFNIVRRSNTQKGFTLLEMLLVIAIIAILAAIVIVAINPARQLAQARNAQRASDLNALHKAVQQYYIDEREWPADGNNTLDDTLQSICGTGVNTGCIDLEAALVPTYIPAMPVNPSGGGYQIAINSNNKPELAAQGSGEQDLNPVVIGTTTAVVTVGGGGDDPECSDGEDNDSDGDTDFPDDADCDDEEDDNETGAEPTYECGDTIDNDSDGDTDMDDANCDSETDDSEAPSEAEIVAALRVGLVGYWPMDVNNSTQPDESANNSSGTVNGATYTASGKVGGAYSFDGGGSNYISVSTANIPLGSSARTTCFWSNETSGGSNNNGDRTAFSYGTNTIRQLWTMAPSNSSDKFYLATAWNDFTTTSTTGSSIWSYVCATYTGTQVKLYVNGGNNVDTFSTTALSTNNSSSAYIGRQINSTYNAFYGLVDEVAIWDRVLSADEISDLYNNGDGLSLVQ